MTSLFDTLRCGRLTLPNRVIMSAMSRNRVEFDGVCGELMATYYAQRASAGLIVSCSTYVSPEGSGGARVPGWCTEAQCAGWVKVAAAVHDAAGRIFGQIYHAGAAGHPDMLPQRHEIVAPSAIDVGGERRVWSGPQPSTPARALATGEIARITEDFVRAAQRAIDAGLDGVEIHASGGYLLEQFICSNSNRRNDRYGGSIANRCRLTLEIVEAVAAAIGADRVGIKVSPAYDRFELVSDDTPRETYSYLAKELGGRGLAYLCVSADPEYVALLRPLFDGPVFANRDYTPESARALVGRDGADGVMFARLFVANPDLPERIRRSAPLNPLDKTTLYAGDGRGLIDYPFLPAR